MALSETQQPDATIYSYNSARGELLYQVVRQPGKKFVQRRPDGAGAWAWNLQGVDRVPYRLPELDAEAEQGGTVWVVEGEKDADRLHTLGLVATTSAGGAAWRWPDQWASFFAGLEWVIVLADNDPPGRDAADQRAQVIAAAGIPRVTRLDLPGLPEKGDVSDWLDQGGTTEHLWRLADQAADLNQPTPGHDDDPGPAEPPPDDDDRPPTLLERIKAATYVGDAIKNIPPPQPLIEGWLDLDTVAMLYGPSGTGKSFLSLDFALSVSTGSWWMNHPVEQGPVVYVAAEGASGVGIRVAAWQQKRNTWQVGPVHWVTIPVNLMTPDWTAAFVEFVAEIQPKLVVFDTLARSMVGGDENTARDVGIVVDNAEKVRRASGACVLIVHHAGKDVTAGARGNSAIKAAMSTELELGAADGILYLKASKQKDSAGGDTLRLALEVVDDSCVVSRATGGMAAGEMPEGALQALRDLVAVVDEDGVSSSVWQRSTDVPERSFHRYRKGLVERGLVAKHGNNAQARYVPTSDGIATAQQGDTE